MVIIDFTVVLDWVPQRERNTEEALAGNEPIRIQTIDPILIASTHEIRMENELTATSQQLVTKLKVRTTIGEVPLTRSDNLERLFALLIEVRLAHGWHWFADHFASFLESLHHGLACGEGRLTSESCVNFAALVGSDPLRGFWVDATITHDDRTSRKVKLTPPLNISSITKGAAHHHARALIRLSRRMSVNRNFHTENRGENLRTRKVLITLIIRIDNQSAASSQQFRTSSFNEHVTRTISLVEGQLVVVARVRASFELSLSNGRLESDVPQAWSFLLVHLATSEIAQEGLLSNLARALTDGVIHLVPIYGQANLGPQVAELFLIGGGELFAQFDEVTTRARNLIASFQLLAFSAVEWWLEVRVVRQRCVDAHAEIVLNTTLGWQAVVVEAHRVKHVVTAHTLIAGDHIGVRVGEHVPDVQMARSSWRWGIDGVHLATRMVSIESICFFSGPFFGPLIFEAFNTHFVRKWGEVSKHHTVFIHAFKSIKAL